MEAAPNLQMPSQEAQVERDASSHGALNGSKTYFIVDAQQHRDPDPASDDSGRAKKRMRMSPDIDHGPAAFDAATDASISIPILKAQEPDGIELIPVKKRRGRRPKNATTASNGSAQVTGLGINTPSLEPPVRRPPGRPRTIRPPIIHVESDKPQRAKYPGRQRVPHPDPYIEALLVRQGELKRLFRVVVASLKPGLADLSDRSLKELQNETKAHEQYDEFADIQQELDVYLVKRMAAIDFELEMHREKLEVITRAQKEIVASNFHRKIKDLQDDAIVRAKDDYMVVAQESRIMDDEEATEDDDDAKDEKLKDKARSRSAFFIDTAKAWEATVARRQVKIALDQIAPDVVQASIKGLATFDRDVRIAAVASYNVTALLDAGDVVRETERAKAKANAKAKAKAKAQEAPPNRDASGLQLLASTLEHLHRGQGLVEPTPKSNANATTKKTTTGSKDSSSSNYYAQRILPQTRPEKSRGADYSPDGILQVQPVTPKTRTHRAGDSGQASNSKARVTPTTLPAWHHFQVSSPAKGKAKGSNASGPTATLPYKSDDSKQRPISVAPQPVLGPAFGDVTNRANMAPQDQLSFPEAQEAHKLPSLESAARGRIEPARKMHGPVPGYMIGSVGSFSRFSVEPSKKPQNPRPLAAKPTGKPEKLAPSTKPNDIQTSHVTSFMNPDGNQRELLESRNITVRRTSMDRPNLAPILPPETAVEQLPSFSPTRVNHGEYAPDMNRPSAPGSRRQSTGGPPIVQQTQGENGSYPETPTGQQPRNTHQRQQSFESAPYMGARAGDRPPAMYSGSTRPLPSMNTQLGQFPTYNQANSPQSYNYSSRTTESHPSQSVGSVPPTHPQSYTYPPSPAVAISPGSAPSSYPPPLTPLQPQPYSTPSYDPRNQYYQQPASKSYPLPPPPSYGQYHSYTQPPAQYQPIYKGLPGPIRDEHRLPPIHTYPGPPGSLPPQTQPGFSQFRHYAPAEPSPTTPQQGSYNGRPG